MMFGLQNKTLLFFLFLRAISKSSSFCEACQEGSVRVPHVVEMRGAHLTSTAQGCIMPGLKNKQKSLYAKYPPTYWVLPCLNNIYIIMVLNLGPHPGK